MIFSKAKSLVFNSTISPYSVYFCLLVFSSQWIGGCSLDWDRMSVGAGIWPEIILMMVRMVQFAQRFRIFFSGGEKKNLTDGSFFGCSYILRQVGIKPG